MSLTLHQSLNCVRGIISDDLLEALDQVHLNMLRDQGVINVGRISKHRDGKELCTNHLMLAFDGHNLPTGKAGYLTCKARDYIQNPCRCFRSQHLDMSLRATGESPYVRNAANQIILLKSAIVNQRV